MIRGVGIDTVRISAVARYMELFGTAFTERTFSENEVRIANLSSKPAEYLSTRFAVKEAVFKAIAHFTKRKGFDIRIVESLNDSDGYPYVIISAKLHVLLDEAAVDVLHISMTSEGDYVTAIAIAETFDEHTTT